MTFEPVQEFLAMTAGELQERIRLARDDLAKAGHRRRRVDAASYLGWLLGYSYMRHAAVRADIDESIDLLREAVSLAPNGHATRTKAERLLVSALCGRGDPDDLAEAFDVVGALFRRGASDARHDGLLVMQLGLILLTRSEAMPKAPMDDVVTMLTDAEARLIGGRTAGQRIVLEAVRFTLAIVLIGRCALHWSTSTDDVARAALCCPVWTIRCWNNSCRDTGRSVHASRMR